MRLFTKRDLWLMPLAVVVGMISAALFRVFVAELWWAEWIVMFVVVMAHYMIWDKR